jgi:hypothetical protein
MLTSKSEFNPSINISLLFSGTIHRLQNILTLIILVGGLSLTSFPTVFEDPLTW